ncbi:MAG TPA: hypothetical protein VMT81_01695 [Candidatus Paceibacterota bacterium]|nr:hypothetical protein [Candidatus Paceibacterota bacterium]
MKRSCFASAAFAVVIIPGIMGTSLDRASDGKELWPDIGEMLVSPGDRYLDALSFSTSGVPETAVVPGGVIREELDIPFYGNLVASLWNLGYDESSTLFLAPYDWRQSVASSAAAIAGVISRAAAASPSGKTDVIAHSMGGLVLEAYLAAATGTPPIGKAIMVGVPRFGAPEALKILNQGDDLGIGFLGIGLNAGEIKQIAQNMPGIYDLLPATGSYSGINQKLLADARALHASLDAEAFNSAETWSIAGGRAPTFDGATGDGTVPFANAFIAPDATHAYLIDSAATGIDHAGLVSDPRAIAVITGILQ